MKLLEPCVLAFSLCLVWLSGCENEPRRKTVATLEPNPLLVQPAAAFSQPIRRTPEILATASRACREPQRADDILVRASQVDEDVQLVVHGGGLQTLGGHAWLIEKLGFAEAPGSSGLLRRRVSSKEKTTFAKALTELLARAEKLVEANEQRLSAAGAPGLLPDDATMPGTLVYTGHPLDVAMPDAGRGVRYFLRILQRDGRTAYARGGRLYVDDSGRLALREGVLAEEFAIPQEARTARILPDGSVEIVTGEGGAKTLGRLSLVPLEQPQGDGRVFTGSPGTPLQPGDAGVGLLKPGHLEFPRVDMDAQVARLVASERNVRLLQRIELGLAEPFRQNTVNLPLQPVEAAPDERAKASPLLIAADMPLAVSHLKALGVQVEAAPGRTLIPAGEREETRAQLVNALTKVLQGLRKRLEISQLNYSGANRLRDEQGKLNPYRRKLLRVGREGELLEAEDETPFRKEFNPNHADAGPDGSVVFPNVSRLVEKADFEQAATEYRLVRTAIERLAPSVIFPDPPTLQVDPKAP